MRRKSGLTRSVVAYETEHGPLADGVVVYVDGDLFAEAFLEVIDGNHKFVFLVLSRLS